jgi:hypothetical protein
MPTTNPDLTYPDVSYADVAAELRRIADAIAPLSAGMPAPSVSLTITNRGATAGEDDEVRVAAIDAVSLAVTGKPGAYGQTFTDGKARYGSRTVISYPVTVSIFDSVTPPGVRSEVAELRAETKRLRAELAAARNA